jgi:hypothetical protein
MASAGLVEKAARQTAGMVEGAKKYGVHQVARQMISHSLASCRAVAEQRLSSDRAAPGRQAVRADLARPALRFLPSGDSDRLRASRA